MSYHPGWCGRKRLNRSQNLFGFCLTAAFTVIVLVTSWCSPLMCEPAWAQLRTGSGTRTLYQTRTPAERADSGPQEEIVDSHSRSDSGKEASGQVVGASYSVPVKVPSSREPRRVPSKSQSAKLASCSSCNATSNQPPTPEQTILEPSVELELEPSEQSQSFSHEGWGDPGQDLSFSENPIGLGQSFASPGSVIGGGCCPPGCFDECCTPIRPLQTWWNRTSIRAEVPLFWRRGHSTPPLVTTSPVGTPAETAGRLGLNTTNILQQGVFGQDAEAGIRIATTTYLDDCRTHGIWFRYWNAGTRNDLNQFDSGDFPILARPFVNTSAPNAPQNDTQLVSFPGDTIGSVGVSGRSRLYGMDVALKSLFYSDRFTRFNWICGYQRVIIGETLVIGSETTVVGDLPPLQGSTISVTDFFQSANRLDAAVLGFQSTRRIARFRLETMFQLGLGNLQRQIEIAGNTTTTSGNTTSSTDQGLLARATNSRRLMDDTFVIAPEAGINLAYAISPMIDFTIGYNYMMVPKVYQAGTLINPDLRVNLSDPLVGQLDPGLNLVETRYWVRTLGLGLQMRY
jgi:hypothetical protein